MEIKLISGALGAEVRGIDLKDSSLENWKKINNLLLEHKALFFRDQDITSQEQINIAKHIGPFERQIYVVLLQQWLKEENKRIDEQNRKMKAKK